MLCVVLHKYFFVNERKCTTRRQRSSIHTHTLNAEIESTRVDYCYYYYYIVTGWVCLIYIIIFKSQKYFFCILGRVPPPPLHYNVEIKHFIFFFLGGVMIIRCVFFEIYTSGWNEIFYFHLFISTYTRADNDIAHRTQTNSMACIVFSLKCCVCKDIKKSVANI